MFVGCKDKATNINMATYFENKVNYQVYGRTGVNEATLSDFTNSDHDDLVQYMSITFTGKPDWLYKMTVNYINFEVYANQNEEVEMYIKVSNLKNGDKSSTGGSSVFSYKVSVSLKENEAVKVSVPVNDYFLSNTATTTVKIEITDSSYFYADGQNTGFKFDVLNFSVNAEHK